MDLVTAINTWLPPAIIVGVIIYTNRLLANGLNKRIDDLREQMQREHGTLAGKVDYLTDAVTKHIMDSSIHSNK